MDPDVRLQSMSAFERYKAVWKDQYPEVLFSVLLISHVSHINIGHLQPDLSSWGADINHISHVTLATDYSCRWGEGCLADCVYVQIHYFRSMCLLMWIMQVSGVGAFPQREANMHTQVHTRGEKRCVCACVAFYLAEGHQGVALLKSTLGYLSRWHPCSGYLRTSLTGQCLMLHNWFYWPALPAECQCWFEAEQLRLTTTAVLILSFIMKC